MQRFKNILVCVRAEDEGRCALERATELAKNNNGTLRVVAVQEELPKWARMLLSPKVRDWEQSVTREREQRLQRLVAPIRDRGVVASTGVLVGKPFIEIIREVLRNNHDLVVTGLEMGESPEKLTIGTTDMRLFRKCPCPVWLVKPTSGRPFERILAAVDPQLGDDVRNALNTKILELATSLSKSEGCELYVLRAWDTLREAFVAHKLSDYMERLQTTRVEIARAFIAKFESDAGAFSVLNVKGMPEAIIPNVAEEKGVELVIMGTVARTGIPGLLMGSTAEKVFRRLRCSVLAVKPEGFVSPVTLPQEGEA